MTLPEVAAALLLVGLVLYALLGGADFGGGVWDLLARGPRAPAQRRLIEDAIAPIWEANHVWLIFVVVLLFSGFPDAYAALSISLHVPMTVFLVGIVLRGSAFTFRHYGGHDDAGQRRWGRVFAVASIVAPFFLGVIVGAITSGELATDGSAPFAWVRPLPIATGCFALALFAFLAAVYLTCETDDAALAADFRRRALAAGVAVAICALAGALAAGGEAPAFRARLLGSWWSWPVQLATGAVAVGAFAALVRRRYRLARAFAIPQVALILVGWALAQRPYLIAPSVTIAGAAAPRFVLALLVGCAIFAALVLAPLLYWLFRIFKRPA